MAVTSAHFSLPGLKHQTNCANPLFLVMLSGAADDATQELLGSNSEEQHLPYFAWLMFSQNHEAKTKAMKLSLLLLALDEASTQQEQHMCFRTLLCQLFH